MHPNPDFVTFWVIRHLPTGNVLPVATGKAGRGGSHVEAVPPAISIRLFRSRAAARGFLTSWLKGKVVADRGYDSGTPYSEGEYFEELRTIPVPSRKAEDYQVQETTLFLSQQLSLVLESSK